MSENVVHIVHTIDTEGPLDEDLPATFKRLEDLFGVTLEPSAQTLAQLQAGAIDLGGREAQVARVFSPELLRYNRDWASVQAMLDTALSQDFRRQMLDDEGNGWVYSWHCVDHLGFVENPRHKDLGYGNVFRFYRNALRQTGSSRDEINWHFHPLSITRRPLSAATSYANSLDVLHYVWCRRIIDDNWFPTTNRPGFHSERIDANLFFEQWLPFDYANQAIEEERTGQNDTLFGRFGDWTRAPADWQGYHPSHDDYQQPGHCRRWIFRCLNVGTRFRLMRENHVVEAFEEARRHGSAILAFADHDYRDLMPDVQYVRSLVSAVRERYGDVSIRFSGAHEAALAHVARREPDRVRPAPELALTLADNRLHVRRVQGEVFGAQPFLALKDKAGRYYHDNFDIVVPGEHWTYMFDDQTLELAAIEAIGVGCAGRSGHSFVSVLRP